MKALTLTQPWATLHVAPSTLNRGRPAKQIESRSWRLPKFGRHAIHAGKGIDASLRASISNGRYFRDPYALALKAAGYSTLDPWMRDYADNFPATADGRAWSRIESEHLRPLPLGAVVGLLTYVECVSGNEIERRHSVGTVNDIEFALGFYSEKAERRFGWVAVETVQLPRPVETRGFQGVWNLSPEIELDVAHALVGK